VPKLDHQDAAYVGHMSADSPVLPQATQMKYRLCEGNGVCFYYLGQSAVRWCLSTWRCSCQPPVPWHHAPVASAGVEDDGNLLGLEAGDLEASLDTLNAMTREVALPSTWTSSPQVIIQYLVCQQPSM
jgi:hypothetical protein